MKRAVLIEVLLLFALAVLIAVGAKYISMSVVSFDTASWISTDASDFIKYGVEYLTYGLLALLAAAADIVAMVLIALKEFPVFKPFIDKRRARKAERKEADRQARIEALESELEELKGDDHEV